MTNVVWRQNMKHIKKIALSLVVAATPLVGWAAADKFPEKDIQLVIPWNAGGSNDIAARQLQNYC